MVCPLLWCVKRALSPVKDSQRRRIYEESKGLIVLPTKTVNGIVGALLGKALMSLEWNRFIKMLRSFRHVVYQAGSTKLSDARSIHRLAPCNSPCCSLPPDTWMPMDAEPHALQVYRDICLFEVQAKGNY